MRRNATWKLSRKKFFGLTKSLSEKELWVHTVFRTKKTTQVFLWSPRFTVLNWRCDRKNKVDTFSEIVSDYTLLYVGKDDSGAREP